MCGSSIPKPACAWQHSSGNAPKEVSELQAGPFHILFTDM